MWAWMGQVGFYGALAALLLINAAGVALVVLQLPGTWLIMLASGVVAWWYSATIGWVTIAILAYGG